MNERSTFHHGNLRAALIEAALITIEAKGLDGLSLRDLAEQTNVSRAAPYRHFDSKLALLAELANWANERIYEAYSEVLETGDSSMHLRLLAQAYLDFAHQRPELFQLLFAGDSLWQREGGIRPKLRSNAYMLFEGAIAKRMPGREHAFIEQTSIACWSTLHGFAMLRITAQLAEFMHIEQIEQLILGLADTVPDCLPVFQDAAPSFAE